MNRRRHATLSRLLIEACGGLEEAAGVPGCRVKKSMLADYQSPHGAAFMPADVMADLEAHCGRPIYSAALAAGSQAAKHAASLTEEACDAAESVAGLQHKIRLAAKDGVITPSERAALARDFEAARSELDDVGALLSGDAG